MPVRARSPTNGPACRRGSSSIPQLCKYTQKLSINSLAVYASHLRYFVIIAPPTLHTNTVRMCDYESYAKQLV